ncbi:unnamed protein product, partial [Polarella glacialis]
VEHQDVKPENMMLFDVSVSSMQAELKLGDFGWAVCNPLPGEPRPVGKLPASGCGSLWYAPPELNPPVEGIQPEMPLLDEHGDPIRGRSDMWSAGVVLYLLLVGHNPFNQALKQPSPEAVDQEVLRLVAVGSYNRRTERWLHLHADARDLISALVRVRPDQRLSPSEALKHPFVTKRTVAGRLAGYGGNAGGAPMVEGEGSVFFRGSVSPLAGRERRWCRLDGLQRLGWLAIARAVAEPELDRAVVQGALEGLEHEFHQLRTRGLPEFSGEATYVSQLARELGTTPVFQWLQDRRAWPDAVRLAFSYLDLDGDGLLGPQDITAHFAGPPNPRRPDVALSSPLKGQPAAVSAKASTAPSQGEGANARELACRWIERWQPGGAVSAAGSSGERLGLSIVGFREALMASCGDDALFGLFDDLDEDGVVKDGAELDGEEFGPVDNEIIGHWGLQQGGDLGGTGGGSVYSSASQGLPMPRAGGENWTANRDRPPPASTTLGRAPPSMKNFDLQEGPALQLPGGI